ncbi:MAG: aspartate kinase, partial [Anaerolineales bacterium]|nr:aspartate kinase [Anaerolineales bacterium]
MQRGSVTKRTLVMKFGGTSVGDTDAMRQVCQIVRDAKANWKNVVVVTSAMSGGTNLLLDHANRAATGDIDDLEAAAQIIREKHAAVADELLVDDAARDSVLAQIERLIVTFGELCRAVAVLGEASPRALDAVASLGERMCVRLLTAVIAESGTPVQFVEASQLIVTDDSFTKAHPDLAQTKEKTRGVLYPLFDEGLVPVITGFMGATPEGAITTLGRGGSDYSAAIIGASLSADDVWIWTDVDGVMSADPRLVPDAHILSEISYNEIAELAYYGAKVLHPKTVRPVIDAGIGLRICNTFNSSRPGTRLVPNKNGDEVVQGPVIKAVTAILQQKLITIEGRGMLGVPGVAARAFGAVAATGTSVPLITQASSEQSICFAVPTESAQAVLGSLQQAFAEELSRRDIDRIWATVDVAIVTVVGTGMRHTPGVS